MNKKMNVQNMLSNNGNTVPNQYYVVEKQNVGPNQDQYLNAHTLTVQTVPARGNMSKKPIEDGWCGTTNDWSINARGKFNTLEDAEKYIIEAYGPCRPLTDLYPDEGEVKIYGVGQYEKMNMEETGNWAYDYIKSEINARSTDHELEEIINALRELAHREGWEIAEKTMNILTQRRKDLQEEE